jgi:hypothetical protein
MGSLDIGHLFGKVTHSIVYKAIKVIAGDVIIILAVFCITYGD